MNKTDESILYIVSSILLINLFLTVWENLNHLELTLVLTSLVVGILIYNELFIVRFDKLRLTFTILITISFLLITYVNLLGGSESIRIFYFILLYQVYRKSPKVVGILVYLFVMIIHLVIKITPLKDMKQIIETITQEVSLFVLVLVIIMLIIGILKQNHHLETLRKELTLRNMESDYTHHSLLQAYNKLEEMTILKERNLIARNMHDTVGHTLTTALIELEVSKMMVNEHDEVELKLTSAIDQVRKGLYDLRTSVKTLKEDVDFYQEMIELIDNTKKHTGIKIRTQLNENLKVLDKKVLGCCYRVLQEGITNGVKHGNATSFIFNMDLIEHRLFLNLENNGVGVTVFNKGFGIQAMEERVKELNGRIFFEYGKESGFGIQVEIPLGGDRYD